eukprot:TRINITY_DN563_c0_g1_i15.p1 TRINITY_DN563_c0_g1~~TRINITY_DN563_c0_g1_i15.p1  ORF type:complete len:107 (+),score=21.79 TRINITY_DN563_c0_g1_i15:652-972(+)
MRVCESIPVVIVGNKVDVKERKVMPRQITFHRKKNLQYYDISVKSGYNYEKPFVYLLRRLVGDYSLCLTEEPALAPSEIEVDSELMSQYQEDFNRSVYYELPDDDF